MMDAILQVLKISFWTLLIPLGVCSLIVFYNGYLHPLSSVPGPFWARTTGISSYIHAKKGDRHVWLWRMFEEYGDRVRVSPNAVVFNNPAAARDIYGMKSNVRRSGFYKVWVMTGTEPSTLNTTDVAGHAYKRKMLNLLFTDRTVRAASEFVIKHTNRWHELLISGEGWSEPFDFSKSVDLMVFDVMGDLCFGRSFEVKEPGPNQFRAIPHIIMNFMRFWYPICRIPVLDVALWLKPRGFDSFLAKHSPPVVKMYDDFVAESVAERLNEERGAKEGSVVRQDMIHFLFQARDPDTGRPAFNDREILAESRFLVIAGADSTSISLAALVFYLTLPSQSRRLKRLTDELRTSFSSVEEIVYGPRLQSCLYLKACIDEAMRLAPTSPSELPREVLPGGLTINGDFYPAGTIVGAQSYSTYRNVESFGDPHVYRPERWIVDEGQGVSEESVTRAKGSFFPWSNGPGNCAGKGLAVMELLIIAARTLWKFDLNRAPGSTLGGGAKGLGLGRDDPDHYMLHDAYIADRQGPMVQFKRAGPR